MKYRGKVAEQYGVKHVDAKATGRLDGISGRMPQLQGDIPEIPALAPINFKEKKYGI